MIPKILHFVWLGSKLPEKEQRNINSWHKYNRQFQIMFWNENNMHNLDISDNCMNAILLGDGIYEYQADIIRYHAVNKFGGFYSDTDIECHKKIPNHFLYNDTIALKPHDNSNWLTNAFFASYVNSDFTTSLLQNIKPTNREHVQKFKCYIYGPVFFTRIMHNLTNNKYKHVLDIKHNTIKILDNCFWSRKNNKRFCTHYFNASWIGDNK